MFKSLFKSISVPSYVWKTVENDLILTEYNTSAEKITNGQIKNDLGRKASEIYKDQYEFYEGLNRCASSKRRVSKEISTVCMTTGEEIYISVEYSHVPPDLVLVHTEDITEKKRIEQKLKESEKKFRTITEQSLLGICIIQDNLIKYINQQFADLLGYTVEEVKNWKSGWFANVIHSEDRDWVMEQARKKQSGAKDVKHYYQYRLIKKTGEIIWLANFSRTILYMGRLANLVTVIDISERKHAEQKLKESEEQY